MMKAETKAKRRVTLSLCGLGWTDESEVGSIPNAQTIVVDQETGEVIEEPGDDRRQKALDQWAEITQEADQLNIIHKDLPVNAPADQIERWALALEKKVREAEEF